MPKIGSGKQACVRSSWAAQLPSLGTIYNQASLPGPSTASQWLSSVPLLHPSSPSLSSLSSTSLSPMVMPWRRQWHPIPVLLPGKSRGWRSLVGCSPWGREELDTTERLHFHFSLSCIGEGNGNPLQCSCLENPRDRGAWWAAVCGVVQSRTQLK